MKTGQILEQTIAAFNDRRYNDAANLAEKGCQDVQGRDEVFWFGLHEICLGYQLLSERQLARAETKLVAAMEKLRNFGFRYQNFEITAALAGVRLGVEEIRAVRERNKKAFDVTLLPTLKLMAKADD
ncbi:MAG: hypothetical protein ABIF77_15660 [bacterium]